MVKVLIIGLRNPGELYRNTRHNAGALFLDWLKNYLNSENFKENKICLSEISKIKINGQLIILTKPLVFMNNSGEAVRKLKNFFKTENQNIIVCHDDSDLMIGNFKIQKERGSAGHKGVESVINHLKSKNFWRIRIGVRPFSLKKTKAENFILKNFSLKEREILKEVFEKILISLRKEIKIKDKPII
ncbi:MAG TPA: aminoacyl-tRNA hydrolase [Candidatus Paceibacterota bacterium]|nr:aminoacyl-tRNA hydrolase [Candidatus Paceibacterota bacterium]HPP64716.1 aminoacyl-tRNA hydrolase [Candidatus Paceibacterota bacterium]